MITGEGSFIEIKKKMEGRKKKGEPFTPKRSPPKLEGPVATKKKPGYKKQDEGLCCIGG